MKKAVLFGLLIALAALASLALSWDVQSRDTRPDPPGEPDAVMPEIASEGAEDALFGPPTPTPPISYCGYNVSTCARKDRYHTGIDYQRSSGDTAVIATNLGFVVHREVMSPYDQGMGSNVILEHVLESGKKIYSSYSHLASIDPAVKLGGTVQKGQVIGIMGGSGYGEPNYWSVHLHFELKDSPVPFSPYGGPYWGYTPTNPDQFGYHDPGSYLGLVAVETPELPPPPPPAVGVTVVSPNKGALGRGTRVVVKWSTSNADPKDLISIDLKRDSASALPDGVNYVSLAQGEANDGTQKVSIPIAIAIAKDWRVVVRHEASGVSDTSDVALRVRR